jgi:mRNA-degrading endonuclease RelE of RelBE toxin-antitoxin system
MFEILIEEEADKFLSSLPSKSQKIVKEHLKNLITNPFPGSQGDKEK